MADLMTFPNTVDEFMEQYKITDTEQVYTNGTELVPIFRMKQWFDHCSERKKGKWLWVDGVRCSNCNHKLQTTGLPSFCPNCGSRNDKRSEDE